ncbi:MAG: FkbM family methyltransferase [Rhodospirillaceae bacterium]|nr:FkbM family methyltransferase [Rhodospirillaceae bacterium]
MKKEIRNFLGFFGASRPPAVPIAWDLRQLQYAQIHFGMDGEDVLLRQIFKFRLAEGKPGRYADIGCAAPVHISNTYLLYAHGWRGIGVDANPEWTGPWAEARPDDVFENVGVGQAPGTAYWFRHPKNVGMSRIVPTNTAPAPEFTGPGTAVRIERLDNLFSRHFPDGILDVLSIDIEGAERDALKSNDWRRWRPGVIIMEAHGFTFDQPRHEPAVAYLYEQGYRLTDKIGANVVLRPA